MHSRGEVAHRQDVSQTASGGVRLPGRESDTRRTIEDVKFKP
jgi:hypothetical protein